MTATNTKIMKGLLLPLFPLLALWASTEASAVPPSALNRGDYGSSLSDIGARFEKEGLIQYPEFEMPSNKEWIEIIKGMFDSNSLPMNQQEKNYTFHSNQTGTFHYPDGSEGTWEGKAHLNYQVEDLQVAYSSISGRSVQVGGQQSAAASQTTTLYTKLRDNYYIFASVRVDANFLVETNDTFVPVGSTLTFFQGDIALSSLGFAVYSNVVTSLSNSSNHFVVATSISTVISEIKEDNIIYLLGDVMTQSVPVNAQRVSEWPKDPVALAQLLEPSNEYSITITEFAGDSTLGKTGQYSTESLSSTTTDKGDVYKTTSESNGLYWQVEPAEMDYQVPLNSLLASVLDLLI